MIQKKVCLIGAFAVGKTSLIQRYVSSIYSEKYLTTVGVKIDKKHLMLGADDMTLMIWDIAGEDDCTAIKPAYLRGSAGCIIVLDGTRLGTLAKAITLYELTREHLGDIPVAFAINKADLKGQWVLEKQHMQTLEALKHPIYLTSAKEGNGVSAMFQALASNMLLETAGQV